MMEIETNNEVSVHTTNTRAGESFATEIERKKKGRSKSIHNSRSKQAGWGDKAKESRCWHVRYRQGTALA